MLRHPTLAKLDELKLTGMARAFAEQLEASAPYADMSFEERLGLLVDREELERTNRRLDYRLRRAKLRQTAAIEDLDFRHPRGLDKRLMSSLIGCSWIAEPRNLLITGPTGTGKTYIACALAHKACREGHTALYVRCSTLLRELELARADGSYGKHLDRMAKTDLELTRFRGHFILLREEKGVHDGQDESAVSVGVSAAVGGAGASGSHPGGAVAGVRADGAVDPQLGRAGRRRRRPRRGGSDDAGARGAATASA
jgi:hypothetical protein